ncbi:DUF6364 family protein [Spirochaeta dissipatitropha]
MNITLSADERLISKSREYARRHNTSLNQLIRDYLQQITNTTDLHSAAQEFEKLCFEQAGKSPDQYRFSREAEYQRGSRSQER